MRPLLGLKGAFDSVDSANDQKGILQGLVNLLRALYPHIYGRSSELSSSLETANCVRQGCPISSSLFDFVINEIMGDVLSGIQDVNVEFANGEKRRPRWCW